MHPMDTLAKLMERIEQHARAEDDIMREGEKRPAKQSKNAAKKATQPEQKSQEKRKEYGLTDYGQGRKENNPPPDPHSFFAINMVFKDPIDMIFFRIKNRSWFRWLADKIPRELKARRETNKRCSYHKDWSQMMENCETYKRFLEEKAAKGLLDEFIEKAPKNRGTAMELDYDQAPRRVIQMIHGLIVLYTCKEV